MRIAAKFVTLSPLVFCVLSLLPIFAYAAPEEPTFDVSVSRSSVAVADAFDVILRVESDADTKVAFETLPESYGDLLVVDYQDQLDLPAPNRAGRRLWQRRITLESFVAGNVDLPIFQAVVSSKSGTESLKSSPLSIKVVSDLSEEDKTSLEVRDLKKTIDVAEPESTNLWPWFLAAASLLATITLAVLGWFAVKLAKRWSQATNFTLAHNRLDEIRSRIEVIPTNTTLAEAESTIRKLIEIETLIPATKLSNAELLAAFCSKPDLSSSLAAFLQTSERVRFAGTKIESTDLQASLDVARNWLTDFENADHENLRWPVSETGSATNTIIGDANNATLPVEVN